MVARKYSIREMFDWFRRGWRAAGPQRGPLTAVAVIFLVAIFGLEQVPVAGEFLRGLVAPILGLGSMLCSRDAAKGVPVRVTAIFRPFADAAILKRVAPFLAATYVLSLLGEWVGRYPSAGPVAIATAIVGAAMSLVPYLLLFTAVPAAEAFLESARSAALNVWNLCVLILAGLGGLIAFVVPVFLLVMLEKSIPALPAVFGGTLLAWIYGGVLLLAILPTFLLTGYFWFEGAFVARTPEPQA